MANIRMLPLPETQNESGNIRLRRMPFPYRAMLAVSSDIDDCTPAVFSAVHRYLNTDDKTPDGIGLNLEIGDSTWLWSFDSRVVSLLDDESEPRLIFKKLAELCQSGWIDAMHSHGDFNTTDKRFNRAMAQRGYDILSMLGIKLPIWINHGNPNNRQNFWSRLTANAYDGDSPDSDAYHLDLAVEYGIRYYWWSELSRFPLSAELPSSVDISLHHLLTTSKNVLKRMIGKGHLATDTRLRTSLTLPVQLRDGNRLWGFTRYSQHPDGIWKRPGRDTLRYQLADTFLHQLVEWQGSAIVYTHFGQPVGEWKAGQPLFDQPDRDALIRLRNLQDSYNVLIATTARLLRYHTMRQCIRFHVETLNAYSSTIVIDGIDDPLTGLRMPEEGELMGLSFDLSGPVEQYRVRLGEKRIMEEFVPYPERSGKQGLHYPWKALTPPSGGFALT